MSYVDPTTIINPNAESLTDEETAIQMQDSFRTGRQFIKTMIDPVLPTMGNHYLECINRLEQMIPQTEDTKTIFYALKAHFNKQDRPVEAYCWHLFEKPVTIKGVDGKDYLQYGWMKLRGEFATWGEMEMEVRAIMQDHDTYTRTFGQRKGVFFPITLAPFASEEAMEQVYDEDVKRQDDVKQKMIDMARKREEALLKMQEEVEDGSLEHYIQQKLKYCVADTMIMRANANIDKFTPILAKQSAIVTSLEAEHPNYNKDGLAMYQEKMTEIGYPVPTNWYDGCVPLGM